MVSHDRRPDEEIPLLRGKAKTPLSWDQISLALLVLIAEPISSEYTFPFINKLIGEIGVTGGDDRKIGYYAGLMESLFSVVQAFTTLQLSRLSDFIGRRPLILLGLLSLSMSCFAFGLSRTFCMLILSRCIASVLDGNIAVVYSLLGDLTDNTNMAQVFVICPATLCVGVGIASFYGGALAKPQERWPHTFRGEFWATYPYFLPSLISGCFTLFAFFICAIFMKESFPLKTDKKPQSENPPVENPQEDLPTNDARPVPMSTLLATYSVMIPIANYGMWGFINTGSCVILPLFFSSPIGIGGLGLSPPIIGTFRAIFGIVDGFVQGLLAPMIVKRLGAKRVFCWAVLCMYPVILFFPLMSAIITVQGKVGPIIWILLIVQAVFWAMWDLSCTVIYMFLTRAAPNKQSLGSVNGLNNSFICVARTTGPALIASLFAASKQYNILGGNFVYVIMAMLLMILVVLSRRLPDLKDGDEE